MKQNEYLDNKIIKALNTADTRANKVLEDLEPLYKKFKKYDLSDEFFINSIYDIERRFLLNLEKYGKLTLLEHEMKWVNMILNFEIFKIGSLRFQFFPMDYKEIERSGEDHMPLTKNIKDRFPEDTPLINIHIERNTDLSNEKVEKSIQEARVFFNNIFPTYNFKGFVTRTWLIYPRIVNMLNTNTNIYRFAQRFEIIATNNAKYQALARVYNTEDLEEIERLPKNTTLEKLIYKNLDMLGVGFGFFPF